MMIGVSVTFIVGNIWVSHIVYKQVLSRRNSCQLQIWRLSIANENTRYIIIAL
jgi:hypothetical protein